MERPRSPILSSPVLAMMKMLSQLMLRWMMGGCCPWRKARPSSIWRSQRLTIRQRSTGMGLTNSMSEPLLLLFISSVMKTMRRVSLLYHEV